MKLFAMTLIVLLGITLWSGVVAAQEEPKTEGMVFRVNGTLQVGPEESVDTAIGINSTVIVEGTARDVVVINGDAEITGTVEREVTAVNGRVRLAPTARVNNVTLTNSQLNEEVGSTVAGSVSRRTGYHFGWGEAIFSFLSWIGLTIALLLAGLVFAAVGPRQLTGAAAALTERFGGSVVAAVVLWIGLPIVAVLTFFTIIGIPVGLLILLVALPVLWIAGYLVACARLGVAVVERSGVRPTVEKPYLAIVIGVILFQIIAIIPIIGGILVFLAGLVGAGALGYLAWSGRGGGLRPLAPGRRRRHRPRSGRACH